jgi:hypothetical protein
MSTREGVGRSHRTPAKHALMSSIYGREIGVVNKGPRHHRGLQRLVWIDLTAGDGIPEDGMDWHRNCSPGINAYHAIRSAKPVDITLYEIKPATFDRLIESLAAHLPDLGYERINATVWHYQDRVVLRAICGNGAEAPVAHIRNTDAVLVSNDPNAITTWAMRPTFAEEIASRAWCFRSISTMGCNPAGLKRLDLTVRGEWFELIGQQEAAVPGHRDLLLAAIKGDSAQWAYLLNEPEKWRPSVERIARTAFGHSGYSLETAWYRHESEQFKELKEKLFFRREERA